MYRHIGSLSCTWDCKFDQSDCQPLTILLFAMSNPKLSLLDDYHRRNKQLHYRHPASQLINETLETDLACQKEALKEGLRGTFVSLLSTSKRSINQLLQQQQHDSLPFVNIKGEVMSNSWRELLRKKLDKSLLQSLTLQQENSTEHHNWKGIWHGSRRDGSGSEVNCESWSSVSPTLTGKGVLLDSGTGNSIDNSMSLLQQNDVTCNTDMAILCVHLTAAAPAVSGIR